MDGSVKKFFNKLNVVVPQTESLVPRLCEYYLHFNVKLLLPEQRVVNNSQTKKRTCPKPTILINKVVDFGNRFLYFVYFFEDMEIKRVN